MQCSLKNQDPHTKINTQHDGPTKHPLQSPKHNSQETCACNFFIFHKQPLHRRMFRCLQASLHYKCYSKSMLQRASEEAWTAVLI